MNIDSSVSGITTRGYRSYLVRFWRSHDESNWRASAQCVQTGLTNLFGELDQLLHFLRTELDDRAAPAEGGHGPLVAHQPPGSEAASPAEEESQ